MDATREDGRYSVPLRELARRVGVSKNAAYRHFQHADDLTVEVAGRAMHELSSAMQRRLAAVDEPDPVLRARRRLAAAGRGYVDFALTEPGLFRVAFSSSAAFTAAGWEASEGPYATLGEVFDELVDVGFLAGHVRPGAEMTCWSAVHGFCVLLLDGPLSGATAHQQTAALDRVLTDVDRAFAATRHGDTIADPEFPARDLRHQPNPSAAVRT